jgi:hypothetical protein
MSSRKLDRNVLFPRKVVKERQLIRRCLNGRRSFGYEPEGALPLGRDVQSERADNDYKGGIGDGGGKLPAMPADIQTIYEGGG